MATRSVGFTLRTDGKAEVKSDFAEVKAAGQDAMNGVALAAEAANDRGAAAAEAFSERQMAAWRKQAAAAKLAAADASSRAQFDTTLAQPGNAGQFATVNLERTTGAARASAAVFDEQARKEEEVAAALVKIRAAIDPLAFAQARYDAELKVYDGLLASGALREEEHAAVVALSSQRLREAQRALEGHNASLGLNRMQFVVGASAAHRFVDSILAGQDPMRAFMMQAGDIATVLQMDDGGVAGGLMKVRALLNPVTLGIAAVTAAVVLSSTSLLQYEGALGKFQSLTQGVGAAAGATAEQLEAMAEQGASAGGVTVGTARDIETSFLQTGKIGAAVFPGLIAMTRDFAAATGTDAKEAAKELASAFADPAKGAEELNARMGFLDAKTLDYIRTLAEQNDLTGAQIALAKALGVSISGAAENVNILSRAWNAVKVEAASAWTWMGKAIDRAANGTAAQQLASLQAQRARSLSDSYGLADTSDIDKRIATLSAQVNASQIQAQRLANQRAQTTAGIVNSVTGNDELVGLRNKLAAVRQTLGDVQQTSGMTAEQLGRTRAAQDALTHAVTTYLPEGEKQAQLGRLDAQIAAAKDPARKAELTAQRSRIEQGGKVISTAQAETVAESAGAKAKVEAAHAGEGHAATLVREAASMEVSARAALGVADAYLKSASAGVEAEARRKAATDATKKGVDVEAEARRQLALQVAEGAASGAKTLSGMVAETAARRAANDNVAAGKLAVADLNQALSDESTLRPLIALQTIAQGDAYDKLGKIIAAYRKQLTDAHTEEARTQAASSVLALQRRIEDAQLSERFAGDTSGAYERAKAALAARREADDRRYSPADAASTLGKSAEAASADLTAGRATSAAQALKSERDRLAITTAEIGLVGKSAEEHDRVIGRLQLQRQLAAALGDEYDRFAPAILSARDAADAADMKLKLMAASVDELRSFGSSFADTMLSADTWSTWANAGKSAMKEIETEFLKLALLNPLKNLIAGDSKLPTLTSALGSLGKLFGAGASTAPVPYTFDFGHNATGTEDWSGGATYLNENGGEIADLPNGTRIYPAAESRRMMQAANDPARVHVTVGLDSELLTAHVTQVSDGRIAMAAPGIAMGGAQLAESRAGKRVRYRIPGR